MSPWFKKLMEKLTALLAIMTLVLVSAIIAFVIYQTITPCPCR